MLIRSLGAAVLAAAAMAAHAGDVRKVTLDVKGMDCAACPVTVTVVLVTETGYPATARR